MKKCGIYKITCLSNGKVYIGQSVDMIKRKASHFYTLRHNKHRNKYLQNCYDKYGEKDLEFQILEICKFEELDLKEEYYMNLYNSTNKKFGFNLKYNEGKQYRHSEETKKKISEKHKGRKVSDETRRRMSIAFKGRKLSKESIEKIRFTKKGKNLGEKNNQAVISDETAKEIILFMENNYLMKIEDISKKFDTTYYIVHNLKENISYKHILPEKREYIKSKFRNYNPNSLKRFKDNEDNPIIGEIIDMFKDGKSQNYISKELKCSRNTIRKILKIGRAHV